MGVQDIARACVKGPAWQCSLESLREGPTAGRHSLSPKHSGRRDRFWARPLSAALIRFATAAIKTSRSRTTWRSCRGTPGKPVSNQ